MELDPAPRRGLLAAGIVIAIVISSGATSTPTVTVRGLSGSEKIPYLQGARVFKRLKELGIELQVEPAGSREIATTFDLTKYDFAFPLIEKETGIRLRFDYVGTLDGTQQIVAGHD